MLTLLTLQLIAQVVTIARQVGMAHLISEDHHHQREVVKSQQVEEQAPNFPLMD